jgi:hypothetical protein
VANNYIRLLDPFDPTNSGGEQLPEGSEYSWWHAGFGYNSTPKKLVTYDLEGSYGGYFNGNRFNLEGGIGYRFQPYGSINIDFDYNDIVLPEPYTSTSYLLLSPRLELTFTNNIFLTTFVQYNEQADKREHQCAVSMAVPASFGYFPGLYRKLPAQRFHGFAGFFKQEPGAGAEDHLLV